MGQVASISGAFALVRILTEYLSPVQYGQLALGLTLVGLMNQLVMGGIAAGVGRFYSIAAEKQDLGEYVLGIWRLVAYSSAAVLIIGAIVLAVLVVLGYRDWVGMVACAVVLSLLRGYNSTINGIQNAARQRGIVAFHGGLDAWLKCVLAVVIMVWLGTSSTNVLIGFSCSAAIVTSCQGLFLRRTLPLGMKGAKHNKSWTDQMWSYAWPFCAWGIFSWMQQVSDRWSLETFTSTEEVGMYAVVFQLGYTPITILLGMAMAFIGPILYQRSGDGTDIKRNKAVHKLSWRIAIVALLVTGMGFFVSLLFHKWVFYLLVAPEYRRVSYLLPWVVLAGGLFAVGQMISLKLMSEMKSLKLLAPKILTALLGVFFNVAGAFLAGLHGVAAALVAFSVVYLFWMMLLGRVQAMNLQYGRT